MLQTNRPVPLNRVQIRDSFWSHYIQLVRETVIPYQWEALNDRIPDAPPSHAIRNFRIAAGREQGEFGGLVFQDSDLAKWLEAVGYSLTQHPDAELERMADEVIDLIADAQQPDGYVNTYFTIKEPDNRWTNLLDCHELYCGGHMIEAAVAYFQATGKRKLLDVMCRFADHVDATFGTEPGKLNGYCGHQEIELALVKLYRVTGEERYLRQSQYFIDQRGQQPSYFLQEWEKRGRTSHWSRGVTPPPDLTYNQSHLPVREQTEAVGHAVRAVYMYSAMADLAALTGDQSLLNACRRLWDSIVSKQMYITGGIGSTHHGEAFTFPYDLPNDTVYAETCASIGLVFFAHRMLQIEPKREYADVMERALYNNILASMARDGKHFFYVNPLEVWPEASDRNPAKRHVRPERQKWFGCSCCPPNVARLLASLGQYVYTCDERTIYAHLYIGGEAECQLQGTTVKLEAKTNYPWDGDVRYVVSVPQPFEFALALRIPGWCAHASIRVNSEDWTESAEVVDGYAMINRVWQAGDTVELTLPMPVERIAANPQVRADAGKVAIQRGPIVYCLEEVDNGSPLSSISLPFDSVLSARFDPELLGGVVVVEGDGCVDDVDSWGPELYRPAQRRVKRTRVRLVPYSVWGNRGTGEMAVWIRTS